ncbi:MAG: response regulator receiver, partial [Anaerolineales bacterium]|nr:response regulator receiver [Anaerolineales bacterium]
MRRVLIADPNTPFATVVAEALQRMGGYKVALTASGPEALKACAELRPTLAVVDVDLPECNPFALIGQMREAVPGLPVVLLPYSREDVPAGLNVQGVLIKPFFLPDLPEIINNILGGPAELELEPEPPPKPVVIDETNSRLLEAHVEALSH